MVWFGGAVPAFQFLPVEEATTGDLVRVVDPLTRLDVTLRVVRPDAGHGVFVLMPGPHAGAATEILIPFEKIKAAMRPIIC